MVSSRMTFLPVTNRLGGSAGVARLVDGAVAVPPPRPPVTVHGRGRAPVVVGVLGGVPPRAMVTQQRLEHLPVVRQRLAELLSGHSGLLVTGADGGAAGVVVERVGGLGGEGRGL